MPMKILVIGDGMSDDPLPELGDRTPLEAARTPALDALAARGEVGRLVTVPEGLRANSDVANLSLLGVDPTRVSAARGPIEAAAAGLALGSDEIAYRANLVTLGGSADSPLAERTLADFSAGHIETPRARVLIGRLSDAAARRGIRLSAGVQYRHLLVMRAKEAAKTHAAHESVGRRLGEILPQGEGAEPLRGLIAESAGILSKEVPPLALWPWGGGRGMTLPPLAGGGVVITAVDLIRGMGRLRGLDVIDVPGATGYYDTDYAGKAAAAANAFESGVSFAVLHIEAPDEAGHAGDAREKVLAIERIDEKIVAPLTKRFGRTLSILVTADHPTLCATRAHGDAPVPYLLAGPGARLGDGAHPGGGVFTERGTAHCVPVAAWTRVSEWLES